MPRLIVELEDFKGQWRMIRSLSPEKLTSLRKVDLCFLCRIRELGWFLAH